MSEQLQVACWCRRPPSRSYNAQKSCISHILHGQPDNDCTEHKLLLLSSRDSPDMPRWAHMKKAAIKQNKTTSSLVVLSPQAVSMAIRPFIPLCMMTDQEKPSFSTLNFIPSLALASHFFKALVPTVTQKLVLFLFPKEMRPNVQSDCLFFLITGECMGLVLIQTREKWRFLG